MCLAQGLQRSDAGEARTRGPSARVKQIVCVQKNLPKTTTLKKSKNCFHDKPSLNAGQKYCKMLQGETTIFLRLT